MIERTPEQLDAVLGVCDAYAASWDGAAPKDVDAYAFLLGSLSFFQSQPLAFVELDPREMAKPPLPGNTNTVYVGKGAFFVFVAPAVRRPLLLALRTASGYALVDPSGNTVIGGVCRRIGSELFYNALVAANVQPGQITLSRFWFYFIFITIYFICSRFFCCAALGQRLRPAARLR